MRGCVGGRMGGCRTLLRMIALSAVLGATVVAAQQTGSVRVTAAGKANVRSEPNTNAAVLTQVANGTVLDLIGVEGDWFHVRVQIGAMRVDAYISKTVAKLEAPAAGTGSATASVPPAPAKPAIPVKDGMSVGVMAGSDVTWLQPNPARVIQIGDKVDSIARNGAAVPAGDAVPANATASSQVTYVWIADGATATATVTDKRPSFYVQYKDVPGVSADDLSPMIVRLAPTTSGVRAIGAIRGRLDQATRMDAELDIAKDFKQDVVKSTAEIAERGVVHLSATQDLAPGQYAVVIRPATKKKLAGSDVLRSSAEARLFGVVWDFGVK